MDIEAFIQKSNQADDIDQLGDALNQTLIPMGYDLCVCITEDSYDLNFFKVSKNSRKHLMNAKSFRENLQEKKLEEFDPVLQATKHCRQTFQWSDVGKLELSEKQRMVLNERIDMVQIDGLVIPMRGWSHGMIGIGLASEKSEVYRDPDSMSAMRIAVNQYLLSRDRLIKSKEYELQLEGASLSKRQREILQQVAVGLSNRDISDKLNVSEKTIEFHLAAAFKKLDVSSRTTAAIKAAQLGVIEYVV